MNYLARVVSEVRQAVSDTMQRLDSDVRLHYQAVTAYVRAKIGKVGGRTGARGKYRVQKYRMTKGFVNYLIKMVPLIAAALFAGWVLAGCGKV